MFKNFKIDRKVLSSYYIAVVFAYFIFVVFGKMVTDSVLTFGKFLGENFGFDFVENGRFWWFFIVVCFLFITFLRGAVVEPLGYFVDTDTEPTWETIIFSFLVFGFFIYLVNQAFGLPMPKNIPVWAVKLFGGYKNTYLPLDYRPEAEVGWSLVPYLWYLAPIAFMYVRRKINIKD
jgi:hypothetical protein